MRPDNIFLRRQEGTRANTLGDRWAFCFASSTTCFGGHRCALNPHFDAPFHASPGHQLSTRMQQGFSAGRTSSRQVGGDRLDRLPAKRSPGSLTSGVISETPSELRWSLKFLGYGAVCDGRFQYQDKEHARVEIFDRSAKQKFSDLNVCGWRIDHKEVDPFGDRNRRWRLTR
jgi:hypothetical protein